MLYHLIDFLEQAYQPPGFQVIYFLTVRAGLAAATALIVSLVFGKRFIAWLAKNQFGERIREGADAGAVDHQHKAGTPTMGGIIILASVLSATLLWGDLTNRYVWLGILAFVWMGLFGFADDYIKVFRKNKAGLQSSTKVIGQVGLGLIFGAVLYFYPPLEEVRSLTNLPFLKDGTMDYDFITHIFGSSVDLGWVIYIPIVVFIMTAVSNAVNLTDGLDGLAAGVSSFVLVGLVVLTYVAGNAVFAPFLGILYLPGIGELTVYATALAFSCFGFLWYNGHPAQIFMGDTGSMALGAAIAAVALLVKVELMLPLLCAAFFIETLSVILQTSYFKYTRKKTGTGVRLFLMAPIHHHFEAQGIHESKIVIRFWIITAILVLLTLLTFRIR